MDWKVCLVETHNRLLTIKIVKEGRDEVHSRKSAVNKNSVISKDDWAKTEDSEQIQFMRRRYGAKKILYLPIDSEVRKPIGAKGITERLFFGSQATNGDLVNTFDTARIGVVAINDKEGAIRVAFSGTGVRS